jgi:trimeric autotransporter adhesin
VRSKLRAKLSYANVASTLALFLALTGASAYAANQLAARSVGERQLRPGAVTAEKLRKNAVTAPKIKALAVKEGKLAGGAVTAAKLAANAVGSGTLATAAVTNEKLAPDAVTGDKVQEGTLSQVPSAARADFATSAEAANPLAFAAVDFEGNLNASLSKDASVVRKAAGVYCVSALDFNPRGAQVSARNVNEGEVSAFVTVGGTEPCPAPQVEVRTYKGVLTSEPFYVSLYR